MFLLLYVSHLMSADDTFIPDDDDDENRALEEHDGSTGKRCRV